MMLRDVVGWILYDKLDVDFSSSASVRFFTQQCIGGLRKDDSVITQEFTNMYEPGILSRGWAFKVQGITFTGIPKELEPTVIATLTVGVKDYESMPVDLWQTYKLPKEVQRFIAELRSFHVELTPVAPTDKPCIVPVRIELRGILYRSIQNEIGGGVGDDA